MLKKHHQTLLLNVPTEHVLQITLNRPEAANAFNTQMATELFSVFEALSLDPTVELNPTVETGKPLSNPSNKAVENTATGNTATQAISDAAQTVRCIVLTGAGPRAFCAGGDLKERNGMSDEAWAKQHLVYERMVRAILNCPIPIVGAVNGAAYGGGCEISAACDFLYAAQSARFALTETSLGIIPGAGGTQTLTRAMGERRAKELILSASVFSSEQACQWGLVNKVLADTELLEQCIAIAARIAGNAPIAVAQAKQAIHRGLQMSLSDGLCFEIEAYNRTVPTQDRVEGVKAFNEKRKPRFSGK